MKRLFKKVNNDVDFKVVNHSVSNDPSELLKQATSFSKTDISRSIDLIRKAINIDPSNFAAHKKLANYLFQAGKRSEAIDYLYKYFLKAEVFYKSATLDQIAVLFKKEKRVFEAIKYECKSIYYYTMIQGPVVYEDFDDFCNSIVMKRKYKEEKIESKVNKELIEFWGTDWLKKYHKKYRQIDKSVSYDMIRTVKKLEPFFDQKGIADFEKYIEEIVER